MTPNARSCGTGDDHMNQQHGGRNDGLGSFLSGALCALGVSVLLAVVIWRDKLRTLVSTSDQPAPPEPMSDPLEEYRAQLFSTMQKAQDEYDKTVLALSGGALGISLAFIKDVIGSGPIVCAVHLLLAWICWGTSLGTVLLSHYTSHKANVYAISQVDECRIYDERPGGNWDRITNILNATAGILFFGGVVFIVVFASSNLEV